jgi:chromosome segregation ATPase
MASKASNTNLSYQQEMNELRKRVEWLDEERRKTTRKLAELEQRGVLQDREIATRDQRIQDLERQLGSLSMQINRLPQVDVQLANFKDDMVAMIEQYDARRVEAEKELDRLRRVEHEAMTRELADIRKELPLIPRLQQDLQLRQAEEARLAQLIGVQQNDVTTLRGQIDAADRSVAFLEQKEKQSNRSLGEIQTTLMEISKRWEPIQNRLDILSDTIGKTQAAHHSITEAQAKLRESIKDWSEQVQMGEHERNRRLAGWQRTIDEFAATMERYSQEWMKFTNQYKDAKAAVDSIPPFREHITQQQQQAFELLRVETQRLEAHWESFRQEDTKKWRNAELDISQRQSTADRREKQTQEKLHALEETLEKIQQDKDLLWRVQTAQAEAIKKWPRMWLEEVESAIEQNPNRRRQPAIMPVREE